MHNFYIDPDISRAQTLSTDFYTSEELFEISKKKIFSHCQFIGDADLVKGLSSAHPIFLLENHLDEPLVLTRDKQNTLHCLSNVCTHRGNIVVENACTTANFRCKYHGRVFHLDGNFVSMPEFKEVQNFPTEEDNLKQLPLFQWGKLLFTALDQKHSFNSFLNDMISRLSWLPLDEFRFIPELSKDYHVKAHWALYCENYLEGFHIPFVHAGLNEVIDFGNYSTEVYKFSNLHIGIAKTNEDCFELPPSSPEYGKNIAAYYFWVFPNMMFNFYPWGLSVNIVKPVSINECKISFLCYVWKENKLSAGAGADLNTVEMEDEQVVENVQRGIRSRFYSHGRYSVTREQGIHHFHQLIADFMK
jgi:choline monooxygenase